MPRNIGVTDKATTVSCPKCGGQLDVRFVQQVERLVESDDTLGYIKNAHAPSDFDVRCVRGKCGWTFYGSWAGLAAVLGRKIATPVTA